MGDLAGYVPLDLDDRGRLLLAAVPEPPHAEAFFDETVADLRSDAIAIAPAELARLQPPDLPAPALLVHPGRAGSTLLARLLDATSDIATYREPGAAAEAVVRGAEVRAPLAAIVLRQLAWHAWPRPCLVKLPSSVTAAVAPSGLLDVWPRLTVVGLQRDPVEVARRLRRALPLTAIAELAAAGAADDVVVAPDGTASHTGPDDGPLETLAARRSEDVTTLLGRVGDGLEVHYDDLVSRPADVLATVVAHLGGALVPPTELGAAVARVMARDAKTGEPLT